MSDWNEDSACVLRQIIAAKGFDLKSKATSSAEGVSNFTKVKTVPPIEFCLKKK